MATGNKKPTPATATKRAAALNYSALKAADAQLPKSSRTSMLDTTPFVEWVTESRDRGIAKAIVVPASGVSQAVSLARQAARRIDLGLKVVVSDPDERDRVTVTFQTKVKRASNKGKPAE